MSPEKAARFHPPLPQGSPPPVSIKWHTTPLMETQTMFMLHKWLQRAFIAILRDFHTHFPQSLWEKVHYFFSDSKAMFFYQLLLLKIGELKWQSYPSPNVKISKFYRIVNWKPKASLALRMEAKTNPGLLQADSHTQKMKAAKEYGR